MLNSRRLVMRPWQNGDLTDLTDLNGDPEVNRWLGGDRLRNSSDAALARYQAEHASQGFGIMHVSNREGLFVGLAGVQPVPRHLPVWPATEGVWRLRPQMWGLGLAHEAMTCILDALPSEASAQILALIAKPNLRSAKVATSLGFVHDSSLDFIHPDQDLDARLRPHCTYRLTRSRHLDKFT